MASLKAEDKLKSAIRRLETTNEQLKQQVAKLKEQRN
jgi:cell division protein FtsB